MAGPIVWHVPLESDCVDIYKGVIYLNIWQWILFYIYSGVALGGLCAGKAHELTGNVLAPEESEQQEKARAIAINRVILAAQRIGDQFAVSTTGSIVGTYNDTLIAQMRNADAQMAALKERNDAALKVVQPANKMGA